jgi:hypothetical protein
MFSSMAGRDRRRPARLRATLAVASVLALTCAVPAAAGLVPNPANDPSLLDEPIEDYAYDDADHCVKTAQPGTKALQGWLERNVRGESWGTVRCEKWGPKEYSVHAEGRAIDWRLDSRRPKERRAAMNLIEALLATDQNGNEHALARRMGVQGIIFDCKSWWSGMDGMGTYSACEGNKHPDPTTAHRDHVHLELNWDGARKQTSFWGSPAKN